MVKLGRSIKNPQEKKTVAEQYNINIVVVNYRQVGEYSTPVTQKDVSIQIIPRLKGKCKSWGITNFIMKTIINCPKDCFSFNGYYDNFCQSK